MIIPRWKLLFMITVLVVILGCCKMERLMDLHNECVYKGGVVIQYGNNGSTVCENPKTREILFTIE